MGGITAFWQAGLFQRSLKAAQDFRRPAVPEGVSALVEAGREKMSNFVVAYDDDDLSRKGEQEKECEEMQRPCNR